MAKVKARRDNVILTIDEVQIDEYVAKGFDIKDMNGNILKKSVPTTLEDIKAEYDNALKRIAELENEIKSLKENKQEESTPIIPKDEGEPIVSTYKKRRTKQNNN
jgi:hypothetical protein